LCVDDDDISGAAANAGGNNITLESLLGGVGQSGRDFDIDSSVYVNGVLTLASELDSHVRETAGDLWLNTVSVPAGTAFIIAPLGSILNGNTSAAPNNQNVLAGRTWLFARDDIGQSTIYRLLKEEKELALKYCLEELLI